LYNKLPLPSMPSLPITSDYCSSNSGSLPSSWFDPVLYLESCSCLCVPRSQSLPSLCQLITFCVFYYCIYHTISWFICWQPLLYYRLSHMAMQNFSLHNSRKHCSHSKIYNLPEWQLCLCLLGLIISLLLIEYRPNSTLLSCHSIWTRKSCSEYHFYL
jgi:hypothetical protein